MPSDELFQFIDEISEEQAENSDFDGDSDGEEAALTTFSSRLTRNIDSPSSTGKVNYHDDDNGGSKTLGMILSDSNDESAGNVDDRLELENENLESRNPPYKFRKSSCRKEKYENIQEDFGPSLNTD
ncbi:hypothetical protein HHI36_006424 [Cryptolaemus montrouzieri]|uniref:Uncharacterized protein n=1 Tax=Cryptolaemus montrouzieri TaxID=559131 RepID=A0ABD2NX95_9CUCU